MQSSHRYLFLLLLLAIFGCQSSEETQYHTENIISLKSDLNSLKRKPEKVKNLSIQRINSTLFPSTELLDFKNLERLTLINKPSKDFEPTHSILEFDTKTLKSLYSLKSVIIIGIGFEQFPVELANIPNLECLSIISGNLDSLPADLSKFKSLKKLDLSINKIRVLPDNVNTNSPIELSIPNNLVQTIPEKFLENSRLTSLDISNREGTMTTLPQNQLKSEDKQRLLKLLKEDKILSLSIQNLSCVEYERIKKMFETREEKKRIKTIEKQNNCE